VQTQNENANANEASDPPRRIRPLANKSRVISDQLGIENFRKNQRDVFFIGGYYFGCSSARAGDSQIADQSIWAKAQDRESSGPAAQGAAISKSPT
jgi:hypothetical protein